MTFERIFLLTFPATHISLLYGDTPCMRKDYLIKSITQYIFFFFLGAFLGYLWEVLLFYVQDGTFCNRGFLYGPWLPVYGVGAVLMLLILRRFQKHPVKVFFLAALLGSFVELFIGWFLAQVFHLRYWDYHGYPLQLGGYICLYSALGFGIAGVLWVCVCARIASHLWRKMPVSLQRIFLTLLILAFLFDCAAALIFPNAGHNITFSLFQTYQPVTC